jgi:hypothetical protein
MRPVTVPRSRGGISARNGLATYGCRLRDASRHPSFRGTLFKVLRARPKLRCCLHCPGRDARIRGRRATDYGPMPRRLRPGWEIVLPKLSVAAGFGAGRRPSPWWLDHAADLSALDFRALRFCRCRRRRTALPRASARPSPWWLDHAADLSALDFRALACVARNVTVPRWLCCCGSPPAGRFLRHALHGIVSVASLPPAAQICSAGDVSKSTSRRCVANA